MSSLTLSDDIIDVGDQLIITATFTNLATGLPADPTTVVWQIRDPAGVVELTGSGFTAPTTNNGTVGTWELTYTVAKNLPGAWYVRAAGTVGLVTAAEGPFIVRASEFATP